MARLKMCDLDDEMVAEWAVKLAPFGGGIVLKALEEVLEEDLYRGQVLPWLVKRCRLLQWNAEKEAEKKKHQREAAKYPRIETRECRRQVLTEQEKRIQEIEAIAVMVEWSDKLNVPYRESLTPEQIEIAREKGFIE